MRRYILTMVILLAGVLIFTDHLFGQSDLKSQIIFADNSLSNEQDAASKAYKEAYKNILDEKWGEAISSLNNFVKTYKYSEWDDAAAFWICFASEKSGKELEEVFKMYEKFLSKYVDSKWRGEVKENLIKLGYKIFASGKQQYKDIITAYRICNYEDINNKELADFYNTLEERAIKAVIDEFYANQDSKKRKILMAELNSIKNQIIVNRYIGLYRKRELILAESLVPENMIFVEGDEFIWGKEGHLSDRLTIPAIKLKVLDFYIDKYEVTQREFQKVMGYNPSFFVNPDAPVDGINNEEAIDYARKIGKRLPTEVEWEYAARGGKKSKGFIYSGSNNLDEVGWYNANSQKSTKPVGLKKANELGIFDMSGNIAEICYAFIRDKEFDPNWRRDNIFGKVPGEKYWISKQSGIVRGGSWRLNSNQCYVFTREFQGYPIHIEEYVDRMTYGFRCVKEIK